MNTITIFDGTTNPVKGEYPSYKGTFEISQDYVLRRDIAQLKTSTVKTHDPDNVIQPYDIIVFYYMDKPRWGKVYSVERDKGFATVEFTYGVDIHQIEIPVYSDQNWNGAIFNNRQHIRTYYLNTDINQGYTTEFSAKVARGNENTISTDTALRQFMRRRPHYEVYTGSGSSSYGFQIGVYDWVDGLYEGDPPQLDKIQPLKFRLDDPFIDSSYVLKVGQDKVTRMRIYASDSTPPGVAWSDYQLLNDGSIVLDTAGYITPWWDAFSTYPYNANAVEPQKFIVKEASEGMWASLDYAKELFAQNEYDNEIEFVVSEDNDLFRLDSDTADPMAQTNTCDWILGRPVEVYLPNSAMYLNTIISGYEISGGKKKIILGLTRTRLTDVINNYINGDNR